MTATDQLEDEKTQALPELTDGELATVTAVRVLAKKTRPPAHYTEATLLGDMEGAGKFVEDPELRKILKTVSGLGTAATRDSIIEVLKHHKYMVKSGKHVVATQKGLDFIGWLDKVCPDLTDVAMTARWEADLDVVAAKGGGKAFETAVALKVTHLVSILKTQPTMAGSGISSSFVEKSPVSDEKRTNSPTDKMLEFAKTIATKVGIALPENVMVDFDACKQFIDDNKDNASRPSEKQLSFAASIAERKKLTVPEAELKNGRLLSKWIDEFK